MDTINHECYVSFEVAKLLKEAGFDWECRCYYETSGKLRGKNSGSFTNHNSPLIWQNNGNTDTQLYSAPTLDVAQRWLREVMNLSVHVFMSPYQSEDKYKWAYSIIYEVCIGRYITYEVAQEAGVKKALEIILENRE